MLSNNIIQRTSSGGTALLVDLAVGAAGGNQLLNNDVQGYSNGIVINQDNNFVLSGNTFGNNNIGIWFVNVSNRVISNLVFPTNVGNPIRLDNVTGFTIDNVTVAGNAASPSGEGILLVHSSNNTITNSTASHRVNGVRLSGSSNGNVVYHNNIFGNVRNISSDQAIELSFSGQGNYWGRSCPDPLFVPGTDSNSPDVVDSFPFGTLDGWLGGGSPGCNVAPVADAGGPYSVNEGATLTVAGSGSDPEGEPLTYAWDLDNDGTFETSGQSVTFSAASLDGPSSHTIAVQVTDNGGLTATDQATVNVLNVAPTASFANTSGTPIASQSAVLAFSDPFDPSAADVAAGFLHSYDCTNDGVFELADASDSSYACSYPAAGTFTARGRIVDKDGGLTEYTVLVTVLTPQQGIQAIIDAVEQLQDDGVLSNGQANPLINHLQQAIHKIDQGQTTQAIHKLQSFITGVNALISNGTLTLAQGQPLIDAANQIIAALGG